MPPSPDQKPESAPKALDISKILLPKKETGPNVDSAQRISAGILLHQEETAALPKPPPRPAPEIQNPKTATATETAISPLQTYKGDMESVVADKGISTVSIAAAEAERRGKQPFKSESPEEKNARFFSTTMIIGGILLVTIAMAALAIVFLRPTSVSVAETAKAPFIYVDESIIVPIPVGRNSRSEVMTSLLAARKQASLPLGLIQWVRFSETNPVQADVRRRIETKEFLNILAPQTPPEIVRTLGTFYLLGLHSFDENQPFLLLQVDSYETAYAGMLAWERTMQEDLSPLFNRNPSPKLGGSSSIERVEAPAFIQTNFVDRVVENRDARLIQNDAGDILLLWTFLGRNTILIATNEYTLREVISRFYTAPVVPIPGK